MTSPTDPIIINGNRFTFEPGETILEVARRNSIDIPTLCHLKGASPPAPAGSAWSRSKAPAPW